MSYKIVVDSCGEIPKEKLAGGFYENVPLELDVDGERIVDDETFDQADVRSPPARHPSGICRPMRTVAQIIFMW